MTEATLAEHSEFDRWIEKARAGDGDAFGQVARSMETRLFRQAYSWCRDESWAEDLVVECLVEGWKCLHRYDGICRISTWLHAILFRTYLKSRRQARSRPIETTRLSPTEISEGERRLQEHATPTTTPGESLAEGEAAQRLWRAIQELPEAHQQVVVARFYEDASLAEIAVALGVSIGTVKSRLHYALEKLRKSSVVVNLFHEARHS